MNLLAGDHISKLFLIFRIQYEFNPLFVAMARFLSVLPFLFLS